MRGEQRFLSHGSVAFRPGHIGQIAKRFGGTDPREFPDCLLTSDAGSKAGMVEDFTTKTMRPPSAVAGGRDFSRRTRNLAHTRGVDAAKITAFATALIDTLLRKYGAALLETDPSTDVKVLSETPLRNGELIRVATEVHRRGGAPIPVDYRFRQSNGEWKVFDVIVEGVSYVQTYRTQFDELLRRQSLEQVTERLQQGQIDVKN